jgi:hypothetical protein
MTQYQGCTYRNESTGVAPRWVVRRKDRDKVCECGTEVDAAFMVGLLGVATEEQINTARDYCLAAYRKEVA